MVGYNQIAVYRIPGLLEAQCETLDIVVVLEQFDDRDRYRGVFGPAQQVLQRVGMVAVVARHWAIVDRLVDDRRARPRHAAFAIVDAVVETRFAIEVGVRPEFDSAVVEQTRSAAIGTAYARHRHCVPIMLDIVGEQLVGIDDDRIVFKDRRAVLIAFEAVVLKSRRIVDRCDREADSAGGRLAITVVQRVVEIGIAPIISARRNRYQSFRVDRDRDISVRFHTLDLQGIAIDICVISQQDERIDLEAATFGNRRRAIVPSNRRIVDRRNLDEDLRLGPPALGRVGNICEGCGAVEIGVGRKADLAIAGERGGATGPTDNLANDHAIAIEVVR